MEPANHKQTVTIFVRSKKVPIRLVEFTKHYGSFPFGPGADLTTRVVEYENRFDEIQQRMIDYASDLAMSADLPIKVIDIEKLNPIERFARLVFRKVRTTPTIELPEAMFVKIEYEQQEIWKSIGVIQR